MNRNRLVLSFALGVVISCGGGSSDDDACTPGTYFCECQQGICVMGLECVQGLCINPSEETSGDGDGDPGDGDPGDGDPGDGDPGDGDPGDGDPGDGDGDPGELATDCADLLASNPGAATGLHTIDPDGAGPIAPFEVLCQMSIDSGGWTLVFTASDDAVNTWTWNNRTSLGDSGFTVGDPSQANTDFMSPMYHSLELGDLLFIHQPSGVTAIYANVGDGAQTLGQVIEAAGSPVCDYALGGNGYPLTGGTLSTSGSLCDTDLYFNLGDHEMDLVSCMDFGSGSNTASYGPVWNADKGAGCPFDDPAEFALGPHGPCGVCPVEFPSKEFNYLGYGNALSLNNGAAGAGANYMQIYVR
jgi:hypothetical protein